LEPQLLRNSLRLGIAILITAAVATWCERIAFVWYPLLAVVVVVDDNTDQSFDQAAARIIGTITGGLVTFVVHTVLNGWIGVIVSFLVTLPLLRRFGWQSATGTATLISIMFLMIPSHVALNWDYVFNRSLDTAVGCLIGILVGRLFWPVDSLAQLRNLETTCRLVLQRQLEAYHDWLPLRQGRPPEPLAAAALAARLQAFEAVLRREQSGPHARLIRRQRWRQKLLLWQQVLEHWLRWESLLAGLPWPEQGSLRPLPEACAQLSLLLQAPESAVRLPPQPIAAQGWSTLATEQRLPLLVLLAMAEEQKPLEASLLSLQHLWRRAAC
jgi:uncharacterized membrane protein YccC